MLTVRHMLAGCALVLGLVACGSDASAAPDAVTAGAHDTRPGGGPPFTFSVRRLGPALQRRVRGSSWHPGCPVPPAELRYLRIGYRGFDRRARVGEMIVAASAVRAVRRVFARLYRARFPIRRMRLVDDYGGSDFASIEADNTSAFNCRRATGSSRFSEHAYGRAIDVNPIENPYVYPDGTTVHPASRPYLDRSRHRRGMAYEGGVLVRAFARVGWSWGGDWQPPSAKDYQHFSATGR
jgi:D-alanyl-D-alanine carboxypeptidase